MNVSELLHKLLALPIPLGSEVIVSKDAADWHGPLTEVSWEEGDETAPPTVWLYGSGWN